MRTINPDNTLIDYSVPLDGLVVPDDAATRAQWGWLEQDGEWLRQLRPGQTLAEPFQVQPELGMES